MNCPKLKSIQIGDFSFSDYSFFKLGKLPSLQSIKLDRFCFYFVMSFSLISLCKHGVSWIDFPQLQSVRFGSYAFHEFHSAVFQSDWMVHLMTQIYPAFILLSLVPVPFLVTVLRIGKWVSKRSITSRTITRWEWNVGIDNWSYL